MADRDNEWQDYYDAFDYFTPEAVRDGCHPRALEKDGNDKAVVLVHGLSDSPHFMTAIGDVFHALGFNVYMPLLHFHGLTEPKGMEGVDLRQWKRNVLWSVQYARERAMTVSVGGLSTGGALSFYTASNAPEVNGDVYLFSAAFRLMVADSGTIGDFAAAVLQSEWLPWIIDLKNSARPLIGDNPYRYDYVDADGARELTRLIRELKGIVAGYDAANPFPRRLFIAHSHADATANIQGVLALRRIVPRDRLGQYLIPKDEENPDNNVAHAELVLAADIKHGKTVLEKKNPKFDEMMEAVKAFATAG